MVAKGKVKDGKAGVGATPVTRTPFLGARQHVADSVKGAEDVERRLC